MHFAGCGDFWWKLAFCREQDLERLERENLSVAQCSDFQVQRQWSSTHHKVPDVMLMESLCSILCNSVALCLQENRRWHGCHPIKTEAWNDNKPRKGERGAVCLQMLLQRCWSSLNWWRIIWHKSQHQWQMILYFYILLFVSICFYILFVYQRSWSDTLRKGWCFLGHLDGFDSQNQATGEVAEDLDTWARSAEDLQQSTF